MKTRAFVSLFLWAAMAAGAPPIAGGPKLTAIADPAVLWPPNHKYRAVSLSLGGDVWTGATANPSVQVTAVAESDEPDNARGRRDGRTHGDIRVVTADGRVLLSSNSAPRVTFDPRTDQLYLRAEKNRRGRRRMYTVTITATDSAGDQTIEIVSIPTRRNQAPAGFTSRPAPGSSGGFGVCTFDYDFSPDPQQFGIGRIYAPVLDEQTCRTAGPFDLVIIAHADFSSGDILEAHLQYDALARHLVSNAFMVVSINRYAQGQVSGAIGIFDQVLEGHLDYLYNDSPVKNVLTDDVALIGHSAGGKSVMTHADVVNDFGKDLNSLVVMAPTIDLTPDRTFEGITDSFLGIHGTHDTDFNAYGSKSPGQVMQSTFKIYDDAGLTGDPDSLSLTKDMVFIKQAGHFFQNSPVAKAYINAHLQVHVHGHSLFNWFLKFQLRPPSLGQQVVWQQHADKDRLVVADFENASATVNTLNGSIEPSPDGIEDLTVDNVFQIDDFSPHHTKVLRFHLDPTPGNGRPNFVAFDLNGPRNLAAFRYLGLRVTQVYHPVDNPDGTPFDFDVKLRSSGGEEDSVSIGDVKSDLHFPVIAPAPVANGDQTKNAMRSYLIPLRRFDVDLSSVTHVTIDFPFMGHGERDLIFDDIEFYH